MEWWLWMMFGGVLLMLEILTPGGFFVVFFALASFIIGALVAFEAGGPPWVQWVLFSVLSVASLLIFRKRLLDKFRPNDELTAGMKDVIGGIVTLSENVPPHGRGKAEFRGTQWAVNNVGPTPLTAGQRCRIEKLEGLTLFVKAE